MPVSIMSQRPDCTPGICASKGMLTNFGVRQRSLAISLPRSTRMPTILLEESRYCMGGSVALVDIVNVPALTRSDLPTLGVQPVGAAAADDEDESSLPQAATVRSRAAEE